jgi:hypothetical protein
VQARQGGAINRNAMDNMNTNTLPSHRASTHDVVVNHNRRGMTVVYRGTVTSWPTVSSSSSSSLADGVGLADMMRIMMKLIWSVPMCSLTDMIHHTRRRYASGHQVTYIMTRITTTIRVTPFT